MLDIIIQGIKLRRSVMFGNIPVQSIAFKPALAFTQMETLGAAGAPVAPAAIFTMRTDRTVLEPIAWRFFSISS